MKKYRKLLKISFVFGVFCGSAFLHGEDERRVPLESIQSKDIPDDYKMHFLFPINKSSKTAVNVEIPEHYKLGCNLSNPGQMFMELVPKNESVHNWTTMITLVQYPGCSSKMSGIANLTQNVFAAMKELSDFKVIENRKTSELQHHTLWQYFDKESKWSEFHKRVYIQAENDVWQITCIARYKDNDSALTKESALEKIKEVVKGIKIVSAEYDGNIPLPLGSSKK
jgi:hypothetical protein